MQKYIWAYVGQRVVLEKLRTIARRTRCNIINYLPYDAMQYMYNLPNYKYHDLKYSDY